MRHARTKAVSTAVAAAVDMVGYAKNRVRIEFNTSIAATTCFLSNNRMTAINQGLPFVGNGGSVVFDVDDYGDLVKYPWFGFTGAAGAISITETFDEP